MSEQLAKGLCERPAKLRTLVSEGRQTLAPDDTEGRAILDRLEALANDLDALHKGAVLISRNADGTVSEFPLDG